LENKPNGYNNMLDSSIDNLSINKISDSSNNKFIPSINIKSNLDVKLTNHKSKWKTMDIKLEVNETSQPIGLTKLNSILSDQIKITSL